jgi:serine phosphatase RsbU (regulator of sigma subunit)
VVCAVYDPPSRILRWARAGHLPIILVRSGCAQRLEQPKGMLLGASAEADYGEAMITLEAGDALLLYTDGLIEQRGTPIDDCLQTLVGIASRPVHDIDAFADLLAAEAASDTGDDACLLVVTLR